MHRFLKLYINDQQAKAAWHAACKLNNTQLAYHLAHSSIHFDYCHAGHDSSLTDTQRQEKEEGKRCAWKDGPAAPSEPQSQSEHEASQELRPSLQTGTTQMSGERLCVSVALMRWNQSVKGEMYAKDTNECTSKGEWLTFGFKYQRNVLSYLMMDANKCIHLSTTLSRYCILLEYFHFLWLYTFTPLHFGGKYYTQPGW